MSRAPAARVRAITTLAAAWVAVAGAAERRLVWHDPLTKVAPAAVAAARENRGGEFSADGWRMKAVRGFLHITLPVDAPREGELEVAISGLDWAAVGRAVGADRKIDFLNLFSNPNGDHHTENGGTAEDALWTLRAGTDAAGGGRYGDDLKLLWASRGAKRAPAHGDGGRPRVRARAVAARRRAVATCVPGWRGGLSCARRAGVLGTARFRADGSTVMGAQRGSVRWTPLWDPIDDRRNRARGASST